MDKKGGSELGRSSPSFSNERPVEKVVGFAIRRLTPRIWVLNLSTYGRTVFALLLAQPVVAE